MDALDHTVTTTPTDVVAELSLEVGKAYYGMNLSTTATLYGRPAAGQPALTAPAFRYETGGEFEFVLSTGDKIWMWTDDPSGCPIILNEIPS